MQYFLLYTLYICVYIYTYKYISWEMYGYIFGEWAQMWKHDVKQNHYFPLWIYCIFQKKKLKRCLKIAGARKNLPGLSTAALFPLSRVGTAVIPTWTFKCGMKCHITLLLHTVLSNLKCFLSSDTFPVHETSGHFLFIFADDESYMQ